MGKKKLPLNQISSIVISLLFANGDSLTSSSLAKLVKVSKQEIKEALEEAKKILKFSGLKIINSAENYQLVTASANSSFVKKLVKNKEEEKIGGAGLEVLAIVAYRKPATEEEIEMIRGVRSSRAIRNLMIKGLIISKEEKGVIKYYPALRFLRSLGIEKIEELPAYQELANDKKLESFLN